MPIIFGVDRVVGLSAGVSAFEPDPGIGPFRGQAHHLSVANSPSRGDQEFEKATAMHFPSKVTQRGRMRDHTAVSFRRRVAV